MEGLSGIYSHTNKLEKKRNLSDAELQSVEATLDGLDLNSTPQNNRKHYSLALRKFKKNI